MNVEQMLMEIKDLGFKWILNLHHADEQAQIICYRRRGLQDKKTVIKYKGPITAIPNIVFLALRDIRALVKSER